MNDIVTRLRNWREVHLARLHLLMDEAADEMERLSANVDCPVPDNAAKQDNTPATHATPSEGNVQGGCTLTDAERALLSRLGEDTREWDKYSNGRPWFVSVEDSATLRGLLERLGGGA